MRRGRDRRIAGYRIGDLLSRHRRSRPGGPGGRRRGPGPTRDVPQGPPGDEGGPRHPDRAGRRGVPRGDRRPRVQDPLRRRLRRPRTARRRGRPDSERLHGRRLRRPTHPSAGHSSPRPTSPRPAGESPGTGAVVNQPDLRGEAGPFLLWLAFKGTVSQEQIVERWGSDPSTDVLVKTLLADGLIGEDDGYIFLEDGGDDFLSEISRGALSDSDRVDFEAFVSNFEPVDTAVKRAVTQWQQGRGGEALGEEALGAVDDWMDA